ncbi:glycosyl transferase family 90-domain-containing protein, partial [Mycena rosella]
LLQRQSKTLEEAVARYTLKTGHPPPRYFADWYRYVAAHRCLIDDYDQVDRDFQPFHTIAKENPAFFQNMTRLAWMTLSSLRVHMKLNEPFSFSPHLPSMDLVFSESDAPRVVFDTTGPKPSKAELAPTDDIPFHVSPNPSIPFFEERPGCTVPTADGSLADVSCASLTFPPPEFTTDLYPVLSKAKLRNPGCFADILVPHQASAYAYSCQLIKPTAGVLYSLITGNHWRGQATGGRIRGTNYLRFPRFRLVDLARSHPALFDVGFTSFYHYNCVATDCNSVEILAAYNIDPLAAYNIDKGMGVEVYEFKYALDVDGNTSSKDFLKLLRSGSLVFQSTAFIEFFSDWLVPYVHYIPVRPDLSDLVKRIEWAMQNDAETRSIQEAGQAMAQYLLTDWQINCYIYRVGVEWGEL